jgi:pimeloyl-ACP methyl ester carboxylesterase
MVAARGLRFHVRRLGEGPPVVMVHGLLTGSIASWYLTVAPRLTPTWSPVMFDLRGHGRSDRPSTGYGAAEMALDLGALTADLDPFPIVAHSFGCVVAARFAIAHPERVTGLVLVEPPFGLRLEADIDLDGVEVAGRGLSRRRHDALRALLDDTTILADVGAEPELTPGEIEALGPRLLVVFGDSSPCAPSADRVRAARPDATVEVRPGGHDLHTDDPEGLAALVRGHLDSWARRPAGVGGAP